MSSQQLFEVLCQMIGELKDGHVNLGAAYDLGRNWSYFEDYPRNFDTELIDEYLGKGNDYQMAAGLKYRVLDDNVGYVRCESFDGSFGEGNLDLMFDNLRSCNGLILDLSENGGGQLTDAHKLAARFTNQKTLVGYVCHKTGKGHNDFSDLEPEYIEASKGVRWQKQVVVLTNRKVFSAANDFVKCMRQFPNVTIMGDQTGGGSGMPFTLELPIGWSVRYSAVVFLDADKQHTEFGIQPDIPLAMDEADLLAHRDTYIEAARQLLIPK
jgi:C-terminal processing protease CtpA/Prc